MLNDERIRRVLLLDEDDSEMTAILERIQEGAFALTRASTGEMIIEAIQRLLIFLGYSTSTSGAYTIDGDFGRGTNRGVAQFQFEHDVPASVTREQLCYECTYRTARKRIDAIDDVAIDSATLNGMLDAAAKAIERDEVTFGNLDDALFHLNSLQERRLLNCREIHERYGNAVNRSMDALREERGIEIQPEWILAIIKQETSGVVRPRFEQHQLSSRNATLPEIDFAELRLQSTSFGLGQVMGFNFRKVGAPSAREMLYSPVDEQVLYVARYIAAKREIVSKKTPTPEDFRMMARYYNGPAYASHHYHERLETWFKEFRRFF
jgi:hypothetical protein